MTLFYPADTTVAGADSYQLLKLKIVFDVFGYIHSALTSGESWQHFGQDEFYVSETSPGKFWKGDKKIGDLSSIRAHHIFVSDQQPKYNS